MNNKVIIITGGSSGIGKALALQYGLLGARVVITGRNKEKQQQNASASLKKSTYYYETIRKTIARKQGLGC